MKISIITIVFNDVYNISSTLDSVIEQSYKNIEYIIIDGNSTDGTNELIQKKIKENSIPLNQSNPSSTLYLEYEREEKGKKIHFKYLSQKDNGIYDAMNKGLKLCSGEWCNFMNSGDRFYNKTCIEELFKAYKNSNSKAQIIYGDSQILLDSNHSKILKSRTKKHKYKHHFIHQGAFIDSNLMKEYKYDTSFKIAGDTDFFTRAYNNGIKFMHFDIVIASFNINGISSNLSFTMFKEDCKIGFKYNKLFPLIHTLKYIFWIIPRVLIRNILPPKIRTKARIFFGKKRF